MKRGLAVAIAALIAIGTLFAVPSAPAGAAVAQVSCPPGTDTDYPPTGNGNCPTTSSSTSTTSASTSSTAGQGTSTTQNVQGTGNTRATTPAGKLPRTGSDVLEFLQAAVLAIGAGVGLLYARRSRAARFTA